MNSSNAAKAAAKAHARALRGKVLRQMSSGVVVISIPVAAWWYWARTERKQIQDQYTAAQESKAQLPKQFQASDTYDYIISNKCQAGDVLLFDRKCERCAASPWAALSCLAAKTFLCGGAENDSYVRSVESGSFDHIGIIVPGYIQNRGDEFDATNLLLLEATPSGIVARPVKERLEQTASRSVLLLQLNCPGEERNKFDDDDDDDNNNDEASMSAREISVKRTREHVERELRQFRDSWIDAGQQQGYQYFHSTVALGGALAYATGLMEFASGPVSPAAYLVLTALQKSAAAPNLNEADNKRIKVEDFLRDYRLTEKHAVRLRPGWRFLAPISIKESGN